MGDALIVTTVSEESLALGDLYDWNDKPERVRLSDLYSPEKWRRLRRKSAELLRRHPNAHHVVEVRPADVWDPPEEPWRTKGLNWHDKKGYRKQHCDAVRKSLETFINGHLDGLYHMVRTGWWVLGKVRVRVVECRPVPEREMRAFARAINGVEPKRAGENQAKRRRRRARRGERK